MTYKAGATTSDSVNLGSNPSPPATRDADDFSVSRLRGVAEKSEQSEQTAHIGRTEVGTVRPAGPWSRELVKAIAMDIGKEAVHHLETMYPAAVAACPATMKLSLRNTIHNEIMAAIEVNDEGQITARLKVRKDRRRKINAIYKKIREPRCVE